MNKYKDRVETLISRIKKFMSIMLCAAKADLILSLGLSIMTGILSPLSLWISKFFVNELVDTFSNEEISKWLVFWLAMMFGVAILQAVAGNITNLVKTRLSDKVSLYVTEHVLQKAIELPMTDFDDSATYNKIQLTIQETPDRCLLLVSSLESLVQSVIQMAGVLGLLLNLHWMIGVMPVIFLVPLVRLRQKVNNVWFQIQGTRVEKRRYSDEMKSILLKNEHIKELRLFGISRKLLKKAVKLQDAFHKENFANSKKYAKINVLTTVADGLYSFCVKLWIIFESLRRGYTVGSVSMYIAAIDSYGSALENIMEQYSFVMEEMLYVGYICEIDEMQKEEEGLEPLREKIQRIEFKNVSFRYRNSQHDTLEHVSLVLEKNHWYALVGINGSGKTTLIKLMMKLYLPSEGEIFVNGKNIAEINGKSLREQMSAVFQDFIKYPFSVAENISLDEGKEDVKHVRDVAKLVELDEDVSILANGYHSQLSCEWRDGVNLSGGQWQKVALARCLYRDAALYIFDEPFAWVDHIAEGEILKTIEVLCNGKIAMLVTHQFDAMPIMDQIFVMEQGRIVESGTHAELLDRKGKYYRLLCLEKQE